MCLETGSWSCCPTGAIVSICLPVNLKISSSHQGLNMIHSLALIQTPEGYAFRYRIPSQSSWNTHISMSVPPFVPDKAHGILQRSVPGMPVHLDSVCYLSVAAHLITSVAPPYTGPYSPHDRVQPMLSRPGNPLPPVFNINITQPLTYRPYTDQHQPWNPHPPPPRFPRRGFWSGSPVSQSLSNTGATPTTARNKFCPRSAKQSHIFDARCSTQTLL